VTYYRRNLPHWHPEGVSLFVTWRLFGTSAPSRQAQSVADPGRAFATYDRALDRAVAGPKWLRNPAVAQCVVDALKYGEEHLHLYTLIAFCVMPNHVHVVFQPLQPIPKITQSIKGFTARAANKILGRTGERFWQDEGYDHAIRNTDEMNKIIRYIERNPVISGLIDAPENWLWSSAFGLANKDNTGLIACATNTR